MCRLLAKVKIVGEASSVQNMVLTGGALVASPQVQPQLVQPQMIDNTMKELVGPIGFNGIIGGGYQCRDSHEQADRGRFQQFATAVCPRDVIA